MRMRCNFSHHGLLRKIEVDGGGPRAALSPIAWDKRDCFLAVRDDDELAFNPVFFKTPSD
jgi:hypothetical protein